jgi:MATE family multidrug resistance protein
MMHALPMTVLQFSLYTLGIWNAIFVGLMLGATQLAAVALASLAGNITLRMLIMGMFTAMDTLAAQAFGADDRKEVGLLAQRCAFLSFVVCIPTYLLWQDSERILLALGQPEDVSALAAEYLKIYFYAFPGMVFQELIKSFLVAQECSVTYLSVLFGIVGVAVHPVLLYYGLKSPLGFMSCAWTNVLTNWLMAGSAIAYITVRRPMKPGTWQGFHFRDALKGTQVWQFLKLAIPGVLSMSEWCFWEATCFIAGNIGTKALAAHSIAYTLVPALYMFPLGVAIPLIQRIGSLLGEGRSTAAWVFAQRGVLLGTLVSSVLALALWCAQGPIIHLFTRDSEVIELCYKMWPWFISFVIADGLFCMQESIPRALGMQLRLAIVTILSLWCIGLPAIFWYALSRHAGLMGIWYLLTPIYLVYNLFLFVAYASVDWAKISESILSQTEQRAITYDAKGSPNLLDAESAATYDAKGCPNSVATSPAATYDAKELPNSIASTTTNTTTASNLDSNLTKTVSNPGFIDGV